MVGFRKKSQDSASFSRSSGAKADGRAGAAAGAPPAPPPPPISAPEELLAPDERGWALGHAPSPALEHGQRLWLSEVPSKRLGLLRSVLGEHLVHIASLEAPDGVEGP